jgi:hypothetical protein
VPSPPEGTSRPAISTRRIRLARRPVPASGRWDKPPPELPAIDLNEGSQLELLEALGTFHRDLPFPAWPEPGFRYYFENEYFSYGDAAVLFAMIRHLAPKRIVEIGAGFSSAVLLDTSERFFDNAIDFTFVEPHPERLLALLRPGDLDRVRLIEEPLQDIPLAMFHSLSGDDVLFVDSSHVSKAGSDVNHLFFEVLPRLAAGVHIHIHDVFHPFEYPPEWVEERGWAWSETYLLRAFLEYNRAFDIRFFNNFLIRFHRDAIARALPTMLKNSGGGIWLRSLEGCAE